MVFSLGCKPSCALDVRVSQIYNGLELGFVCNTFRTMKVGQIQNSVQGEQVLRIRLRLLTRSN